MASAPTSVAAYWKRVSLRVVELFMVISSRLSRLLGGPRSTARSNQPHQFPHFSAEQFSRRHRQGDARLIRRLVHVGAVALAHEIPVEDQHLVHRLAAVIAVVDHQ